MGHWHARVYRRNLRRDSACAVSKRIAKLRLIAPDAVIWQQAVEVGTGKSHSLRDAAKDRSYRRQNSHRGGFVIFFK